MIVVVRLGSYIGIDKIKSNATLHAHLSHPCQSLKKKKGASKSTAIGTKFCAMDRWWLIRQPKNYAKHIVGEKIEP